MGRSLRQHVIRLTKSDFEPSFLSIKLCRGQACAIYTDAVSDAAIAQDLATVADRELVGRRRADVADAADTLRCRTL